MGRPARQPAFVGRAAVVRTNALPLDKQLCMLEMDGEAPAEGATLRVNGDYAGHVTSSAFSPALDRSVMLGWLRQRDDGRGGTALPDTVTVDGRTARRVRRRSFDPEGRRARA